MARGTADVVHATDRGELALRGRPICGYGASVNGGTNSGKFPGAGDDGFDRPRVTPVPAPPDDQLIRLAKVGTILGGIATLIIARWLHKHIEIRWRS